MAKKLGEETQVTLDLKTIGMIITFVISLFFDAFGLFKTLFEVSAICFKSLFLRYLLISF